MIRKYGGKNYENKKADKPGSNKSGKNGGIPAGKAGTPVDNAAKK